MAKSAVNSTKPLLTKADRSYLSAFRKSSQKHVNRVTKTPAKALQELIDAGIYSKDGKLDKRYRSAA
jgi:hypothetical protein